MTMREMGTDVIISQINEIDLKYIERLTANRMSIARPLNNCPVLAKAIASMLKKTVNNTMHDM
jgi:hypothetical protein